MRLHSLQLKGFRQFVDTTVHFSDASFIIGQNNTGKSSILKAIDCLLKASDKIEMDDCLHSNTPDGEKKLYTSSVELIAEFRNLPLEAKLWRGFKGRVFQYTPEADGDSGLRIFYKRVFNGQTGKCQKFMRQYPRTLKTEFAKLKKPEDLISAGVPLEAFQNICDSTKFDVNLKPDELSQIDEIWDIDETNDEWIENPGGFQQNVLSRLPHFLLIPAQDRIAEFGDTKGTLYNILNELFSEVRENSKHYLEAKKHLELLEKEFDPKDSKSDLGIMMNDLNKVLGGVFPKTQINAGASLQNADAVLNPVFKITMQSNIETPVSHQGTGLVRAAVFALLRYKAARDQKEKDIGRGIIIGFEEPEIYLHPQAAYQMREVIYELAQASGNQIICTTHLPYMIDLGKKPKQILNYCSKIVHASALDIETVDVRAFNISEAFNAIVDDDRDHLKMLLKVDDYVARVFFANKILIVEGDTEEVVLRQTLSLLPDEKRKEISAEWQIVKARGKATIISLVRYLKALGMNPYVMHDLDDVDGATKFNRPIADAVGNPNQLFVLQKCIEDELGYKAPESEKPFAAYTNIKDWKSFEDVPHSWRLIYSHQLRK